VCAKFNSIGNVNIVRFNIFIRIWKTCV